MVEHVVGIGSFGIVFSKMLGNYGHKKRREISLGEWEVYGKQRNLEKGKEIYGEKIREDGILKWHTDQDFIKPGKNQIIKILPTKHTVIQAMNSLRFFPKGNKNCYNLPLFTQYYKFLFRAGFYYGNYNGLSKLPSFRLEIDGKFWANVTASVSEEPVYHELLYIIKGGNATGCLVQTTDDEVPFISSLEATLQLHDSYKFLDNNTARYFHSRINYGADQSVENQDFIKSGKNQIIKILPTNLTLIQTVNTLRFFPKGNKNCYNLPLFTQYYKFLFRAGFYYGNYDGLSKPQSFQLEIGGKFWANVTASLSEEPVYHELLYIFKGEKVTVCLVRTTDDEVPFISFLEATELLSDSYKFLDNNTALYLHSRINYGANESVEQTVDVSNEINNRIWKSKELPDYLNIHSNVTPSGIYFTKTVHMATSILPPQTTVQQAYLALYFVDPLYRSSPNQTSRVEIYVNNNKLAVADVPNFRRYEEECQVVTLFPAPIVGLAANVTISPAEGSSLAPLLNAIEVFSAIDVSKAALVQIFSNFCYFSRVDCRSFVFLTVLIYGMSQHMDN
ncbi:unnamed protein product [Camellia sinensis]